MQTQAYFNNIQSEVLSFLSEAQESLWVAVAWFTDKELLTKLCEQAQNGLQVQVLLMEDEINQNPEYGLDFSALEAVGGRVFWIPSSSEQLMHNKFVVSDQQSVLTGSYNWSQRAKRNHENITITQESPELAQQFIQEFQRIRQSYDPNTPALLIMLKFLSVWKYWVKRLLWQIQRILLIKVKSYKKYCLNIWERIYRFWEKCKACFVNKAMLEPLL